SLQRVANASAPWVPTALFRLTIYMLRPVARFIRAHADAAWLRQMMVVALRYRNAGRRHVGQIVAKLLHLSQEILPSVRLGSQDAGTTFSRPMIVFDDLARHFDLVLERQHGREKSGTFIRGWHIKI